MNLLPSISRMRLRLGLLALAALVALVAVDRFGKHRPVEAAGAEVDRILLANRAGVLHRPGDDAPFTGWVVDRYKDGGVQLRSAVVDGRLHGASTGWFTNGVRELREEFRSGLPHGPRTTWHPNGRKRSEGRLVEGKQEGRYRQWDEAGTLVAEAEFENGKPHGLSRAWHPDGSLKAEALMDHGEVRTRQVYPAGLRWEPALLAETSPPPSNPQTR